MNIICTLKRPCLFKLVFLICFSICSETYASETSADPDLPGGRRRDFLGMSYPTMGNKWPNRKGSVWIHSQASFKHIIYPDFGQQNGLPPIHLTADYSFDHHWSLGAYYGRFRSTYVDVYGNEFYESDIKSYFGGLRLTLHFTDIFNNAFGEVVNVRKWDFYGSAFIGWHSISWDVAPKYFGQQDFSEGSFGSLGLVLGCRWLPFKRLGVFAEAGKGPTGYFSFGLSGKIIK